MDGSDDFEEVFKIPNENDHIGVCNTTNSRKRFALCTSDSLSWRNLLWINEFFQGTIDPTKAEADQFSPVVDLDQYTYGFYFSSGLWLIKPLSSPKFAPNLKSGFQCGPPIMLQAYDISGYEGQILWVHLRLWHQPLTLFDRTEAHWYYKVTKTSFCQCHFKTSSNRYE